MVHVAGPWITETIVEVTVEVSSRDVLDVAAYWNLGFDGEPLPEGDDLTLLYAKVAFPTLAAAQAQWRLEREALDARRRPARRAARRRRRADI